LENSQPVEPQPQASPYIDKAALAQRLGLSRRTIDNWMQRGLPHLKLGTRRVRFDLRDVEPWLQRQCHTVRYGRMR
jgi:excisionase family DNA binding protein